MAKRSYTSQPATDAPKFEVEFELDGVEFRGEGSVNMLDISEFARLANAGVDTTDPAAVAIIAEMFHTLLGEAEYKRFLAHVRRHNTAPEVLLAIIGDMSAADTGRPTSRSSGSPDGPPTVPGTAKVVSFSRGTVEEKPVEPTPALVSYG
ncbi:hypothetical protein ABZW11_26665 [Nonomuraea sp. NPDC004580]|uniref:hypothetical protein n=1 Tax=Nonomuraea sp. NPDC004580 TaxID=3154552 RepID=UPI0033A4B76C